MKKFVLIISLLILLLADTVCSYAYFGWDHFSGGNAEGQNAPEPAAQPEDDEDETPLISFPGSSEPEPVTQPGADETDQTPLISFPQDKEPEPITLPDDEEEPPLISFPVEKRKDGGKVKIEPEKLEEPDPLEGIETQKGVVYRQYPCGDDLSFMIVYQPIMTRSQSGQTSEGMFIFFRVQIQNLTDRTLSGLKYESFTLSKGDGENAEVYPLSPFFSQVTSYLWSLGLFRDIIPPRGTLDTYLVFDVQGVYNDPWVLTFLPTERLSNEQFTPIRITLPPINQQ